MDRQVDLVEARLPEADQAVIEERLDMVGRLLGATRLMDMYLKSPEMVDRFVQDFMDGRYPLCHPCRNPVKTNRNHPPVKPKNKFDGWDWVAICFLFIIFSPCNFCFLTKKRAFQN